MLVGKLQQTKPPALSKEEDPSSLIPYSVKKCSYQDRKVNRLKIQVCTLQLSQTSDLTFKKKKKKKKFKCLSSLIVKPQEHSIYLRIKKFTTINVSFPSKDNQCVPIPAS